jgi:hypothetical protein
MESGFGFTAIHLYQAFIVLVTVAFGHFPQNESKSCVARLQRVVVRCWNGESLLDAVAGWRYPNRQWGLNTRYLYSVELTTVVGGLLTYCIGDCAITVFGSCLGSGVVLPRGAFVGYE